MADKKVSLEIQIEAENAGKSLSQLKNEFKETQKQLDGLNPKSKEYLSTLQRLGGLKDQMGDLKNEINAFAGTDNKLKAFGGAVQGIAGGFQAATAMSALFGTENEDLQKTLLKVQAAMSFSQAISSLGGLSDAFKVLGNVIKANPIMMIGTIIAGIGVALFALKDKIQVVGDAFNWLGEKLKDIGEFFGLYSREAESLLAANEKIAESLDKLNDKWQHQINLLKAAGKDTYVAEQTRLGILKKGTEDQIANMEKARKITGEIDQKKYDELKKQLLEYNQESEVLRQQHITDIANKISKENEENNKKYQDALNKKRDLLKQHLSEIEILEMKSFETNFDAQQTDIDKRMQQKLWEAQVEKQIDDEKTANKLKRKQDEKEALLMIEQSTIAGVAALGELFISNQKKLEKFQKAAALAQIAIDTAKAISSLVQASQGNPLNLLTGGVAGIAQFTSGMAMILTNMAKAKQLITSSGTASPNISTPRGGGGGNDFAPTGNLAPPQIQQNASTLINPDGTVNVQGNGGRQMQKVYVVESDISGMQNRVGSINKKAKII
jgi:hypothetical protein